jgi:hypothetical protein
VTLEGLLSQRPRRGTVEAQLPSLTGPRGEI